MTLAALPLAAIEADLAHLTALRRDLHAHPELGFEEHRTAARIRTELEACGIPVFAEIGGTGLVGLVEGRGGPGRSIGLRADMDALPIEEDSDFPWRSTVPGRFHGCGHDGHVAMLVGAARHLAAHRDFPGRVVLVFQPAEEGLGGARAMLRDGLFARFPCDEIYALHNDPNRGFCEVGLRRGPVSASADFFDIDVRGNGGHAAFPHRTIDAGLVAIAIAQALHAIVGRDIDPNEAAVVSVTAMNAGTTYNVIPGTARLSGTIRSFSPLVRERIAGRIGTLAAGIAQAYGAEARVSIRDVFSTLVNHDAQAAALAKAARAVVGAGKVDTDVPKVTTSEDFADMLMAVPGAYCFLGQGAGAALHNPRYAFNDAVIPIGAALFARIALDRLARLSLSI
ncbi:amidohydrolase [Ancylobacter defluvii]|uniref:Hippurate hydrolase n=1 Tax=Ancylobacter defluvii TaxID=1282440 RepID=A0A9W6JUB6_9HYPH|nr:amidohydrolase [Ancylobacter defluvii]MBS7590058.1 amidohydrolase [Ancylobacter defluvii]GLK82668.1 hippurate hydrolase [Ancylobacter defluvii]